jgi:hypothetical protein
MTVKKTQRLDPIEPHLALDNTGQIWVFVPRSEFRRALAMGRAGTYAIALDPRETQIGLANLSQATIETVSGIRAEFSK